MENRCVICGEIIPEGRQVCPQCEKGHYNGTKQHETTKGAIIMTKEDIIRKLTSRKFWAAIVAFVTGLLIYFGNTAEQAEKVASLIMSGAAVIAYILGEGLIDAASARSDVYVVDEKPPEIDE